MCTCSSQAKPGRTTRRGADATELRVDDMSCSHCASTITKAIETAMPGASVDVDLESKIVSVRGVEDPARLEAIIAEAGYRAVPA